MPNPVHSFHNHCFSFDGGELALHQNLMTCVIIGRHGPVIVSTDYDWLSAPIICITPGAPHRVSLPKGGAEIVYLDGVRLAAARSAFISLSSEWHRLPRAFETHDHPALAAFRAQLHTDRTPPDPDVMKIVNALYSDPFTRLSQTDLAAALDLERTQALRHFKATTGQTFRRFKIWAAVVAAARSAHNGGKIGLAGVETGFSDAAHLARTANIVFGVTPTEGLSGLTRIFTLPSTTAFA